MPGEAPGPLSPADLTPGGLVGRAAETAAISRLLDGERLVTVTGLPGVGKTAVSLAAAVAAAGNFADGALLVRLDPLRDEALLPHTILAALGLGDRFTSSPLEVLTEQLHDRHMLLIFDTCEHLIGACAALTAALLQPCPKVQILATSREPLRVPGESATSIRPLRLRDAMTLFGQRAAEAGVTIAPQNRAAVASICVQLDKLPLAIDLAVAELAQQGPGQAGPAARPSMSAPLARLLSRLEADYDFLRDPSRPVARHQTLRAAIGWSHELCTPAERLLWARLSVFAGPFRLKDAQDVCTTSLLPDEEVAAGLALLTERSVLLADEGANEGVGGDPGFLLPATLRAYGRQMLRRLAEDAEFDDRYQRWQDRRRRARGAQPRNKPRSLGHGPDHGPRL
jgi:predicted ATPase